MKWLCRLLEHDWRVVHVTPHEPFFDGWSQSYGGRDDLREECARCHGRRWITLDWTPTSELTAWLAHEA